MALYISVSQKIRRYLLWLTKFPTLASAAALAPMLALWAPSQRHRNIFP